MGTSDGTISMQCSKATYNPKGRRLRVCGVGRLVALAAGLVDLRGKLDDTLRPACQRRQAQQDAKDGLAA
jgi:hypothetical protein